MSRPWNNFASNAKRLKKNFPRRDIRNLQQPIRHARHVNELSTEPLEYEECHHMGQLTNIDEVAAMNINRQQPRQPLVCWNCRHPGHAFIAHSFVIDAEKRMLPCQIVQIVSRETSGGAWEGQGTYVEPKILLSRTNN